MSWQPEPLRDPSHEAVSALEAVEGYLAEWEIGYTGCELVFVADDEGRRDANGRAAVRVTGWLGRRALFGFVPGDGHNGPITGQYPDGVRVSSGSALRPTAYASAYGIKHPAAQEALRHAAVVVVDLFGDGEPKETLEEYLPPDAHDLIDDELISDITDTLFLVGWKLGQPARHPISNYAEQIATHLILLEAQSALELHGSSLTAEACDAAQGELEHAFEDVLDPSWVYEELPAIDHLSFADLVPAGVPRRAALWAPWHPEGGDPPPRTTGDHEAIWTLTDKPGNSASDEDGTEDRRQKAVRREEELPDMFTAVRWQASDGACLRGELPERKLLVLRVPTRNGDRATRWHLQCFRDEDAAREKQPEWSHPLAWKQVFEMLPSKVHPLAVDAVFAEVAAAKDRASQLTHRALPGGAFDSLQMPVRLLNGVEAMREELERCRRMGIIRDRRLTASGLRHAEFGRKDRMRFEAVVRFTFETERTLEQVQADFGEVVEEIASLPITLDLEAHPSDDKSVQVRCGLAVESAVEASEVADEVIYQLSWRLRLEPIEGCNEVHFEIHDLVEASGG